MFRTASTKLTRPLLAAVITALFASLIVTTSPGTSEAAVAETWRLHGRVACAQGRPVVGIWVESANGVSGWADWTPGSVADWQATWSYHLPVVASSDRVQLRIGCGGTPQDWRSDQGDQWRTVSRSTQISSICQDYRGRRDRGCRPWGDTVILGMPFRLGTDRLQGWSTAYYPEEHPEGHHTVYGGEWSIDLYAPDGTDVYAQAWRATGWPRMIVRDIRNGCQSRMFGDGGKVVVIDVYSGSKLVGRVWYMHLRDVTVREGQNVRGMRIGELDTFNLGSWSSCYGVSYSSSVHLHLEARTNGDRVSCYWNRVVGSHQPRYEALGMVGRVDRRGTACRGSYVPPGTVRTR